LNGLDELRSISDFVKKSIDSCSHLKILELRFFYTNGPNLDAFDNMPKLSLGKFTWTSHKIYDVAFVENLLDKLGECYQSLHHVSIYCEISQLINLDRLTIFLRKLGQGMVETFSVGFKLMENMSLKRKLRLDDGNAENERDEDDDFFENKDEAPWTYVVLSELANFQHLSKLTLLNLDFGQRTTRQENSPKITDLLRKIAEKLSILNFEDNYRLDDQIFQESFSHVMPNLSELTISDARLNFRTLVTIVSEFLPNLTRLVLSNNERLSFKDLVVDLHHRLHKCQEFPGCNPKVSLEPLLCELGTAEGHVHENAEKLKELHFCGLEMVRSHSIVKIHRICRPVVRSD